jgi:hypothetical protein
MRKINSDFQTVIQKKEQTLKGPNLLATKKMAKIPKIVAQLMYSPNQITKTLLQTKIISKTYLKQVFQL